MTHQNQNQMQNIPAQASSVVRQLEVLLFKAARAPVTLARMQPAVPRPTITKSKLSIGFVFLALVEFVEIVRWFGRRSK